MARVELDSPAVVVYRRVKVSLCLARITAIKVSQGHAGVERDGDAIVGDGPVQVSFGITFSSPVVICLC